MNHEWSEAILPPLDAAELWIADPCRAADGPYHSARMGFNAAKKRQAGQAARSPTGADMLEWSRRAPGGSRALRDASLTGPEGLSYHTAVHGQPGLRIVGARQ
jgi:hypothetical protein